MARIIDADVQEILDTDHDTTPFITAANVLMNKLLATPIASGDLSAEQLVEIERWLAAHFACMMDPRENEVWADRARAVFEGKSGMGLDFTRYGQQVKFLDTSGILAAWDKQSSQGRRQATVVVAPRKEENPLTTTG